MRCYGQLVCIFTKCDFTSFQSVYGCLFVHRHDVSTRFITPVFPNCLCWLPSCCFTRTHVKLCNTIVYGDIKIYRSKVKSFSEKNWVLHPPRILVSSLGAKQLITSIFFCHTITHWYYPVYISGVISIFIKCAICQVFAQWVTYCERAWQLCSFTQFDSDAT